MLLLALDAGGELTLAGELIPAKRPPTAAADFAVAGCETLEPPNKSAKRSMLLAGPFPAAGVPVVI